MSTNEPRQLSWRDPAGIVLLQGNRILRGVVPSACGELEKLLNFPWYKQLEAQGCIPKSQWLNAQPEEFAGREQFIWLEHQPLGFPFYPHEITALQLHDAANLTLAIAQKALEHDWILKDAAAWNVLFDNGKPYFCDILSFVPRNNSGIWPGYAQFCRHFIIPLLLHKELGIQPSSLFLIYRDGITPEQARPMLKGFKAWRQPALEAVTLPTMFGKIGRGYVNAEAKKLPIPRNPELARNLLQSTFKRLEKHIDALNPIKANYQTQWADYETNRPHYSENDLSAKQNFIRQSLAGLSGKALLDLGCNAGEFSKLAASLGMRVVAADFDEGALTQLYSELRIHPNNISPVILNIGRPTPAVGWMNSEVPSFFDRARGKFDCVMALGLVHHLLISERATLPMIGELIQAINPKMLIIEWIEPCDPRFQEIAGLNRHFYEQLDATQFEAVFSTGYKLVRKQSLPSGSRSLYCWEK